MESHCKVSFEVLDSEFPVEREFYVASGVRLDLLHEIILWLLGMREIEGVNVRYTGDSFIAGSSEGKWYPVSDRKVWREKYYAFEPREVLETLEFESTRMSFSIHLTIHSNSSAIEGIKEYVLCSGGRGWAEEWGGPKDHINRTLRHRFPDIQRYVFEDKPQECPQCSYSQLTEILFGYIQYNEEQMRDVESEKILIGGCMIPEDPPDWCCLRCGTQFFPVNSTWVNPIIRIL